MDASVAVAYLLGETSETERAGILGDAHAPALLDIEVTQTLRGLLRAGKIDVFTADRARTELAELAIRRYVDAQLLPGAWELRDVCTTYDALYVALAQGLGATLITRDAPLARGVASLVDVSLG